jgi:hypothetical protein
MFHLSVGEGLGSEKQRMFPPVSCPRHAGVALFSLVDEREDVPKVVPY